MRDAATVQDAAGPGDVSRLGVAFAVGSGLSYSVTVVVGRNLADHGVSSATALGIRFTLATVLMLTVLAIRRQPLMPVPGERLAVFLLGAIGYGIESTCFYAGLQHGSAAAVGLLFYSYPAVVTIVEMVLGDLDATATLLLALGLSVSGVAVVVAAAGDVTITPTGAALAFAASVAFSAYFLVSHRLVKRSPPQVIAVWVSAGAAVSMISRGIVTGTLHRPEGVWPQLLTYAVANCCAFGFMFAALRRLGPSRTAVLLTVEVLGTVALAALFLGETLRPIQLAGGVAIAAGAVLAARAQRVSTPADELEATPP